MEKIRISTVGKLTDRGYTLIELALVVLLVGLMLFIAAPRVRDTLVNDSLKAAARQLIGATRELRAEAVRGQVDYILHLDLNGNAYWTYTSDMSPEKRYERRRDAVRFPDPIRIADIYQAGNKKQTDGEATVTFFRKGYVQPVIIHLAEGDRFFTLFFSPFLNTVKTFDKYVDDPELSFSVAP